MAAASVTARPTRNVAATRALWVLQVVLGLFFIVASAAPKFFGESGAVQIFAEIGVGQWLRYLTGFLELAGGIGLMIPKLSGLAASGLALLMVFAWAAQAFVLDTGFWYTPIILGVLAGIVAWVRRAEIRALVSR